MPNNKSLHPHSRYKSFGYAIQGLKSVTGTEPNMQIHCVAAIVAIILGFVQHIGFAKWIAIIVAIALVIITEALNTCIELLCDLAVGTEIHPLVKRIKDIAAGAVLIASIASAAIGVLVFLL